MAMDVTPTTEDITKGTSRMLTVERLREHLMVLGLATDGRKPELLKRLQDAVGAPERTSGAQRGSCTDTGATAGSDSDRFTIEALDDISNGALSTDKGTAQDVERVASKVPGPVNGGADKRCASKDLSKNSFALRIEVVNNDPAPVIIFFRKPSNGIASKYYIQAHKKPNRVAISFTTLKSACRYAIVLSVARMKVKRSVFVHMNVFLEEGVRNTLLVQSTKIEPCEDSEFRRNVMQALEDMHELVSDMSSFWLEGGSRE